MDVKNPIFIVGTGRCGSTIFHRMLSYHPQVTWLSPWCLKYLDKPERNQLAMWILDMPLPERYVRKTFYTSELYPFWDYYCRGFSNPCRDLRREDASHRTKKIVRNVMGRVILPSRDRLLIKITGWPRMGFLKEIFPDAKFIHMYRDGRAVANSLLNIHWWSGWKGPTAWQWGELTLEQRAKWEKYGKSFVVLAAIEWEILMTAFEEAKQTIPLEDLLEIRYEELCARPLEMFQMATGFVNLDWTSGFESTVKKFSLKNTNDKWQEDLNEVQQRMLCEYLQDTLQKYGYT